MEENKDNKNSEGLKNSIAVGALIVIIAGVLLTVGLYIKARIEFNANV